jgi:hypothetical protein
MTSEIKADKWSPASGTSATIGDSGDTYTIPSGVTFTNNGTANGFGITAANFRPNANPIIINGDMQVAQRGTSVSTTAGGYKTVDRFQFNTGGGATGNATFTQESDAPSNTVFRKSLKISPNATETIDGGKNLAFTYALEGQDVQVLQHGSASPPKATLSFWVKSNKTGAYCVQVKEETISNESYLLFEYSISQANTWEQKVLTWTGNSAHTLNNDNTMGFRLCWHLACGSDDHASATTTWTDATPFKATSNQVNLFDSTSNNWYLTGVQLEIGEFTSATLPPFQTESFGNNLARCQRYYYKFTDESENPPNASDTTIGLISSYNGSSFDCPIQFPVSMRSKPSIEQNTGTNMYRIYQSNSNDTFTALASSNDSNNTESINLQPNTSISATQGHSGILQTMDATCFVSFLAEL